MSRHVSHLALAAITVCALFASSRETRAAWNESYCDIFTNGAAALPAALEAYHQEGEDRGCTRSIRFMWPQVVPLHEGLTFSALPPLGRTYGPAIRKCVFDGETPESGCLADSVVDVVLDFSDYREDGGDCPIRIAEGAMIDIINVTLLVPNAEKAVCTLDGNPIAVDDRNNPYAWIRDVRIEEAAPTRAYQRHMLMEREPTLRRIPTF